MVLGPIPTLRRWLGVTVLGAPGALLTGAVGWKLFGCPVCQGFLVAIAAGTTLSLFMNSVWGGWYTLSTPTSPWLRKLARASIYIPTGLYIAATVAVLTKINAPLGAAYGLMAGLSLRRLRSCVKERGERPRRDAGRRWHRVLAIANISGSLLTPLLASVAFVSFLGPGLKNPSELALLFCAYTLLNALLHALLVELPFRLTR